VKSFSSCEVPFADPFSDLVALPFEDFVCAGIGLFPDLPSAVLVPLVLTDDLVFVVGIK
jgi:hypothetical protein